jgi:hypothetical protein
VLADAAQIRSTRDTAPSYDDAMRTPTILLPLLLILADGVACRDDEPTGGEFGDPCGYNPADDEPKTCAEGFGCFGYCEEKCTDDSDCQPVDGYRHECENDGLCHIYCAEGSLACPQDLATPLECGIAWCEGAS